MLQTWARSVPDLPIGYIGYIGLNLGPQDPRGASNKVWYA